MEIVSTTKIMIHGATEIPTEMLCRMGDDLKIILVNDVWLLITRLKDNRMSGEQLMFNNGTYAFVLPENQLSALQLKPGDDIKLVYSDELEFIIVQKTNAEKNEA